MTAPRIIPDSVRADQANASDPDVSAFVAANAGVGKTHVLAQRVIRLLLDGVDPSNILCLTFTKAAAANMASRVFDRLAKWIALEDDDLDAAIRDIGAKATGAAQRARARRLFAAALETPGGLKVQTIHAFCTRLLHQFPFEANVAARFSVLDERDETELLDRTTTAVLLEAALHPDTPLADALTVAITAAADTTLRELVREAINRRDKVAAWLTAAGSVDAAVAQLSHDLGIALDDTLDRVNAEIVDGPILPASEWPSIAAICGEGSKSDVGQGQQLIAAAAARGRQRIDDYLCVFFTQKSEPRKAIVTAALAKKHPALAERLAQEQDRLTHLLDRRNAVVTRERTAALLTIVAHVIDRYRAEKNRRGLLDYNDLIDKTLDMLSTVAPGWVHYKLDLGIDHVLIDEAQDTSPKQWAIIRALVSEFAAGAGARGRRSRTIFAVGDEKQSIFSFQGAAPYMFDRMWREFRTAFQSAELEWRSVRLDHSFRSGENIVGAVYEVFCAHDIYPSVTSDRDGMAPHRALPDAAPGLVEIWPLESAEKRREIEGWDAPFDALAETSPQVRLARKIAARVRRSIDAGEIVTMGDESAPMTAGNVMVLVRQRGPLFEAIIRALKDADVPVAGADRLKLTEHIAVIDLMALADALLLPHDDLALAVALKSPLFGFDDAQLFALAWERKGTLGATLRARGGDQPIFAEAQARLERCSTAAQRSPFAFYAWLLGPEGGRGKILARLGPEAADALDEFLALALDYERREIPSLQGFLAWLRAAETEIKRDMEITRNEVRVMTVHGAKGLEAPVVILADTTTPPAGPRHPRLLALTPPNAVPGTPEHLLWAGRKETDAAPVATARMHALAEAENEYRRLLYVAMTRAADRLIVCGCEGQRKRPAGCWYDLVFNGLHDKEGFAQVGDGEDRIWRYCKTERKPAEAKARVQAAASEGKPPDWLRRDVPGERARTHAITPSMAIDDEITARGPSAASGENRKLALLRGTLVHRLMQSLPQVTPERRIAAAQRYLARAGGELAPTERERLAEEIGAILDDSRFAALFAPGSRAEVPIVGVIKRPGQATLAVAGQIDRLAITPESVLIADYKTNRPAPRSVAEVEKTYGAYVRQLALYRAVLQKLYPDRPVRAALLWTDVPDLMELSATTLDAAATRFTSL